MRVRDAIGMGLSGACVVHCLALPVLISVMPALLPLRSEAVHIGFATLALLALVSAVRRWPDTATGLALQIAASIAVAGLFLAVLAAPSEQAEQIITVLSAAVLGLSHVVAWWVSRGDAHAAVTAPTCR